jgi:hypothetical protein
MEGHGTCSSVLLPSAIYMSAQSKGSRLAANCALASASACCRTALDSVSQKPAPACIQSQGKNEYFRFLASNSGVLQNTPQDMRDSNKGNTSCP